MLIHGDSVSRGRPRPTETIHRDKRVMDLLSSQPLSRNELWEHLSNEEPISPSQVWLSLNRLRKIGQIKKCAGAGEYVWTAQLDLPCP